MNNRKKLSLAFVFFALAVSLATAWTVSFKAATDVDDPAEQALIETAQQQLRLQEEILRLQQEEIERLQGDGASGDDPEGQAARQRLNQLTEQYQQLDQQREAQRQFRWRGGRGETLSPEAQRELDLLQGQIDGNNTAIAEGFDTLSTLLTNGTADEIPQEWPPVSDPETEAVDRSEAESTRQATSTIASCNVREVEHLVELFTRVKNEETPRSNLDYYRELTEARPR